MKYILSLALCLSLLPAFGQNISNAQLEHWTIDASGEFPDSNFWTSDKFLPLGSVTRTTESHSGYAALLETVTSPFAEQPGILAYGDISTNITGVPYTGRPTSFNFWYKYEPVNNDSAHAVLFLSKFANGSQDIIGVAEFFITAGVSSYTQANIPVMYLSASAPDSIVIFFTSSNENMSLGSKLYIDDISLETPLQKEEFTTTTINIYPNPSLERFVISPSGMQSFDLEIRDITGRLIMQQDTLNGDFTVACGTWMPGAYFIRIREDEKISVHKFMRR